MLHVFPSEQSTCCNQEQLFTNQMTGDTCCLQHATRTRCATCGVWVEHCFLFGCGQWMCPDPFIALALRQEYLFPPTILH